MIMLNGKKHPLGNHLKTAFESGYSNAVASFARLTHRKIYFNNFHFNFHSLDSRDFREQKLFEKNGSNVLITTEIFGDLTGKSYLLLSQQEFDLLTNTIPEGKDGLNLKEEFIKELDNILSASVITCLANDLGLKMYGDIPTWVGKVSSKIEDIIYDDFSELGGEVYVNSIFFSFDKQPQARPLFVWVVENQFEKVSKTKVLEA